MSGIIRAIMGLSQWVHTMRKFDVELILMRGREKEKKIKLENNPTCIIMTAFSNIQIQIIITDKYKSR